MTVHHSGIATVLYWNQIYFSWKTPSRPEPNLHKFESSSPVAWVILGPVTGPNHSAPTMQLVTSASESCGHAWSISHLGIMQSGLGV